MNWPRPKAWGVKSRPTGSCRTFRTERSSDDMPRRRSATAVIAAFAMFAAHQAQAQPIDAFYKGKTVTLLIGSGVAGGTDAWSRTLAKHIGRHIPGSPTVVPVNMPGAAGLKMT